MTDGGAGGGGRLSDQGRSGSGSDHVEQGVQAQ